MITKILLRNGDLVEIAPANSGHVNAYLQLIRELANDDESYVLVNYSGTVPTLGAVSQRALSWNTGNIIMHFALEGERVIGFCGQHIGPSYGPDLQPHVSEVWYAVSRDFRGSGLIYALMSVALRSVNVKYLEAYVDTRNYRSAALLEKLGLKRLLVIHENILDRKKGIFADDYFYRGTKDVALLQTSRIMDERGLTFL